MGKTKSDVPADGIPGVKKTTQTTFERRDYGPKLKTNLTSGTQRLTVQGHGYSLRRRASHSDLSSTNDATTWSGTSSQPIPVSNMFESLENMDQEDDSISTISTTSIAKSDLDIRVKKTVKARCPPITVRNKSAIEINKLISRLGGEGDNYNLRNFQHAVQIKVKCTDLFQRITTELKKNKTEFFTHAKPEEASVKIVLSGLPLFEEEDLICELKKNNISPREVKVLSKSDNGNRVLYLLNFAKGSVKLTQLREVKFICNVVVWWRYYTRNKTDVIQCFRCQGFGHGSRYCNMVPRCVKCGEKHGSNECQLPTKAALEKAPEAVRKKIKCANCNLNHTANFKDCSARKDYLKHQEKKKHRKSTPQAAQTSTSPRKFTPSEVAPGLSFANIAAGSGFGSGPRVRAEQNNASPDDLFTVTEFLGLAREMYARLSKCTSREEQFFALHELMVKYVYIH